MTAKRQHPGATGVGKPLQWRLSVEQREVIADSLLEFCSETTDLNDFIQGVEDCVRVYKQMKAVADKSSAAAVRANLKAAQSAAERLVKGIRALDGNSLNVVAEALGHRDVQSQALEILAGLMKASLIWAHRYPPARGPRPRPERVQLAAHLLMLVRRHTSIKPTATEGKPFESLLKLALAFAGERHEDLHRLAARALRGDVTVEETPGMIIQSVPKEQ